MSAVRHAAQCIEALNEHNEELSHGRGNSAVEQTLVRMMSDIDRRRCQICSCKNPHFGFGPPLTRKGRPIWACFQHYRQVEDMLCSGTAAQDDDQHRLL